MSTNPNVAVLEMHAASRLTKAIRGHKLLIDTSSLLMRSAPLFWQHLVPILRRYGTRANVPAICIETLKNHCVGAKRKPEIKALAHEALRRLQELNLQGLVAIRATPGMDEGQPAKVILMRELTHFRVNFPLLLITQDSNLARDAEALNAAGSVRGKPVRVLRINRYGYLSAIGSQAERMSAQQNKMPENNWLGAF